MFLKTKTKDDGKEVNIIIDKIVSFAPLQDDKTQGSVVMTNCGVTYSVEMSTQSIRSAIKKLYGDGED